MARLGARANCPTLLEAFAAENWTSLRRLKGHGSFFAAVRAGRARLNLLISVCRSSTYCRCPLGFAGFTALGLVLELLIVEEELFASREEKLRAAVDAL